LGHPLEANAGAHASHSFTVRAPTAERGARAAVKPSANIRERMTIPPVGLRVKTATLSAADRDRASHGRPVGSPGQCPYRIVMPPALGARPRCMSPGPDMGSGDERQLNRWAASRCEDPLATLQRPPWWEIHSRQDAGPENASGEPRKSPRVRLGQSRTRGFARVSPLRLLPPGAAPASGRATAPRSDSPGVC
jgi:hypothetical protein